jgi:ABC-type multidrug transport system fused ATPase/permease subunit
MKILKKLADLLTKQECRHAMILMGMFLIMALLDVVGLASIMPFMGVLANPQLVESNALLNSLYISLGFKDQMKFLFAFGIVVFLLLIASLIFKTMVTYLQIRFILFREFSIGKRLIEGYLHQPYSWFLNRNSADLGKTVLSEVSAVIYSGMMPLMTLIAQGVVTIALLTLLIVVDPYLAFLVTVVLGIAYGVIFSLMNSLLKRLGQARLSANQERFIAVSEALGAAKEVKVGGFEDVYIQRFSAPAQIYAHSQTTAQIIAQLPRFFLEAIVFGGMLLVTLYLSTISGSFLDALPVIALYAVIGYRIMPALQQIYAAFTQLRFAGPAIDLLHTDLMNLNPAVNKNQGNITPMSLNKAISLNNITYRYPKATEPALKDINLIIPAHSMVAFVGATGSGKTTMVDVILSLLEPLEGQLIVDDQIITTNNRRRWQRTIGYVPQHIYLADDSVSANIAFGVNSKDVDQQLIERAAKIANLHDFVTKDLPHGYSSIIGERGVRLSGGQRQRIGIARALYHNPRVLILDEATSALDNLTEQAVMEAVNNLGNEITIILVAHRLTTVRKCDHIYVMERGKLTASGTYEELSKNNYHFASMANKV